tara:strand:- start:921 stop:1136 length:216 start_codon:yes stop_codon:yes gene_type:complete
MKKMLKLIVYLVILRFVVKLFNENTSVKEQVDKLKEEITNLETEDLETKLKDFFKKYDPNNKDQQENQEDI